MRNFTRTGTVMATDSPQSAEAEAQLNADLEIYQEQVL